jgi:hypothetical protein
MSNRVNPCDMVGPGRPPEPGRHYADYRDLEEYHAGMWRRVSSEASQLNLMALALRLLRDPDRFRAALAKVLRDWPVSCRVELTRRGNHLAWFGQAACCLAHGVPEDLTRRAWWKLTPAEQRAADELARAAEASWREVNRG